MVPIYSLDSVSVPLLLPAQSNSICCGSEGKKSHGRNCAAWRGVFLESSGHSCLWSVLEA